MVYGKDNRLQLAVRDQQPRLNMSLEMPETLFQGELRCLDLFLTNCGSVPINRLYLISHSPGLISFGKQPDQPAGPKSLFDFPVITDSSLSEVAENGSSVEKPLDYLPIPLENGKSLAPGASAKIAIWIRGPEHLGANDVKISCYYEKETSETLTKKRSYRILCKDYKLRVLPSVTVSATRSDTCVFDSQVSEMITVHISNISKESTSSKSPLEEIFITQVSLVSHDTQLQRFQSKNESSLAVSRLDSSSVNLKAVKPPQEKKVKDNKPNFGTLMFSSVKSNNSAKGSFSIQSAPFVDFLKPGFSFTDLKASPQLQEDLVVVFWRGGGGASSANPHITGQLIVPLKQAKVIPGSNDTDSTDGGSRSEPQQIGATAPKVAMPVLVKFEAQDSEYSFGTGRICTVPCKLVVTNPNSVAGKFCSRVDEFSVPSFLGCVNSDVIVEAHQTLELEFMVAVTELGLFQCKGLQFQMISPTGTEDDLKRAGLIPIDISFVVGR